MKIISRLSKKLWQWPYGLVWKITEKHTLRSRRKKYGCFVSIMRPRQGDKILDVGVAPYALRGTNFLEQWYPYPENITALANDNPERFKDFSKCFPKVKLVFGDGKNLQFPDNHFDIVFSNAVVEHVGAEDKQRKFIHELVRVGKKSFITTPNYWFPLEAHTLIPFAHWLPEKTKFRIYKKLGREYWADVNRLNLLTSGRFLSLFPKEIRVKLYKHRILKITSTLSAAVENA